MTEYRLVVGLRLDKPEYYLGFDRVSVENANFRSVREMLNDHLEELESHLFALRAILATRDPEEAEHLLQDGLRLQVSEVILRPRVSASTFLPRLREIAGEPAPSEMRSADDGRA